MIPWWVGLILFLVGVNAGYICLALLSANKEDKRDCLNCLFGQEEDGPVVCALTNAETETPCEHWEDNGNRNNKFFS